MERCVVAWWQVATDVSVVFFCLFSCAFVVCVWLLCSDGGCPFCTSTNTGTDLDDVETRAIEATRKQAVARGDPDTLRKDRWEVINVTVG